MLGLRNAALTSLAEEAPGFRIINAAFPNLAEEVRDARIDIMLL